MDHDISQIEARNEHQESRLLNAHDAIEIIRTLEWPIPQNTLAEFADCQPKDLEISGLNIRVRPSAVIKQQILGSKHPKIGVVKPYLKKTIPLTKDGNKERGIAFACLLHWYAEKNLSHIGQADPSLCFVGDVFSEDFYFAAKRFKQRRKQFNALAQEIFDRWDFVQERLISTGVTKTRRESGKF